MRLILLDLNASRVYANYNVYRPACAGIVCVVGQKSLFASTATEP